MKRLVFAIGVVALGFAASSPARADFAVVKWGSGYCRVWYDSAVKPSDGKFVQWRYRWHHKWHWAHQTAKWDKADHKLHWAVAAKECQHWWW
jgi:hypothetical protein